MARIRTASIATLGCKLNQSESDAMARQLAEAGALLVPFGQPADLCVVNTCTVTHLGDRKSRQMIRQAARANPGSAIAVAGCYAETDPAAVAALEGVVAVLGNQGKDRLVESLRDHGLEVGGEPNPAAPFGPVPPAPFPAREGGDEGGPIYPAPSPTAGEGDASGSPSPAGKGPGVGSSSRSRAFVKIQEGCDNHCSYCIVPQARGHQRSRPADEVVQEIRRLSAGGYEEVVLTGVNITSYGRDYGSPAARPEERALGLRRLAERILSETKVGRLRLSSLEPEDWTPDMYELWASGRLCRHLHLSLQSGCDSVLRRMRRRYNVNHFARVVAEARRALPGVAVTTDVIAGFPGESEADHRETESFLRETGFAGLHVFKYSPRSGTAAAEMSGQVDPRTKQERSDRLLALGREMAREFHSRFLGSVLGALWEERVPDPEARRLRLEREGGGSAWWTGLSDNYVRVYVPSARPISGLVSGASIDRLVDEGVVGTLIR